MNPIEFEVEKTIKSSAKEICEKVLDVTEWSNFNGYGLLPGIEKAEFEKQTDKMIGSRIRVKNSDGSEHIEEILEWELGEKIVMKIHGFPTTLSFMATHFIEEWNFEKLGKDEMLVTRKFHLFPVSFLTRHFLKQTAILFETAIAEHLDKITKNMSKN
jgi:hypothetical protein